MLNNPKSTGVVHRNPYLVQIIHDETGLVGQPSAYLHNLLTSAEVYHQEVCNILSWCIFMLEDFGLQKDADEARSRVRNLRHEHQGMSDADG